ncbi:MAG: ATP-binding protein [Bacteroidetes bacterium]|nr:ATP-binding protein [Bacteroidota bacterium]
MNPFLINDYLLPEYFCDRGSETKTLITNIDNQSNTAFFAQRRIGKTALIQHVFYLLKKKNTTAIYIDIYATQNLKDFTNQLANSIYRVFPENKTIGKRFWEAIKLLRPIISMDEMTGNPQLSLDITQTKQFENTIPQLLHFLEMQNIKTVIAIDEFQQILNYPEKNVEALLRSAIQRLKNVVFIFCGSNQKMMHHIFNSAKRPFYASTKNINLQKINTAVYARFIKQQFEKQKFRINDDDIELILELTDCHTYYTQRLCHEIFAGGVKTIKTNAILQTLNRILTDNEGIYFQYRNLITPPQWNLLKAIAIEHKIEQPYAQKFIHKHNLGTSANVKRSIEALVEKEMIYYHAGIARPYYEVYDKFLMRWLQHKQIIQNV